MNRLDKSKRVHIISALFDGHSMRAQLSCVTFYLIPSSSSCRKSVKLAKPPNVEYSPISHASGFNATRSGHSLMQKKDVPDRTRGKRYRGMCMWVVIDAYTRLVPSGGIGDRNECHGRHFVFDLAPPSLDMRTPCR